MLPQKNYFCGMVTTFQQFLNRPLAEDFSFRNQLFSSVQGGLYVFLFLYFFIPGQFAPEQSRVQMLALLAVGVAGATLLANFVIPRLWPQPYDEDRWTVGKHVAQTVFVLFCISGSNYLMLRMTGNQTPSFGNMLLTVTLIGFFPITLTVLLAQQRQLKRNLRQARVLNAALPVQVESAPTPIAQLVLTGDAPDRPVGITLVSSVGKDRLSLQPDQLLAIESVGNYAEVYWLNSGELQQTTLRLTLKEAETALAGKGSFFRSHRAFIVNLQAVVHTTGNARGYQLTVRELPKEIPVSRGFVDAFEERLR